MNRNIDRTLDEWKSSSSRLPLLLCGARQVGKSYSISAFGSRSFDNCVTVDFEIEPRFAACFAGSLEPREICSAIMAVTGSEIVPGRTLLFLDEIQRCPRAIMSLRYFHEKMPSLHVIGAGSLLEFALDNEDLHMPVGRVQYLDVYPLTFGEFLEALGHAQAARTLDAADDPRRPLPTAVHEHLLALTRTYLTIGGMPAVVRQYLSDGNIVACGRLQAAIVQTYRDDFAKYASKARLPHMEKVFGMVPRMVGRKFKYSAVDDATSSRELRVALQLLEKAGVVHRVRQTSGAGLPMEADADDRNFKVVFLDVGLMQNLCGLGREIVESRDLVSVYSGALAEQFVGQELLATADPYVRSGLFYWAREARSSCAEVDYLVAHGHRVVPVEVKSGSGGTLRSLHLFMQEKSSPLGIRLSQHDLGFERRLLSVPLYAVAQLHRLMNAALASEGAPTSV